MARNKNKEKGLRKNYMSQTEIDEFSASIRSVMATPVDEVLLKNVFTTEAWKRLSRHQSFCFTFGCETYNQNKKKALEALAQAETILKTLNEVQSFVTAYTDALRARDSHYFWHESAFGEEWRNNVLDAYEKTIPFDAEKFGEILFYSEEHFELVMKSANEGFISPGTLSTLYLYQHRIYPEIWKKRRVILDDERLAIIAAG